jgi:hypothetical protein
MFGLFKKKKKKDSSDKPLSKKERDLLTKGEKHKNLKETLEEELTREEKRKKKKKKNGPNWPAFIVLLLSMFIGLFFFLYGRVARMGLQGLVPQFPESTPKPEGQIEQKNAPTPRPHTKSNQEGLIIFEKE